MVAINCELLSIFRGVFIKVHLHEFKWRVECKSTTHITQLIDTYLRHHKTQIWCMITSSNENRNVPRCWPFVWGIHRWPVNSPHKGQCRGALMLSLIGAWTNDWANNRFTGDLRRYRTHSIWRNCNGWLKRQTKSTNVNPINLITSMRASLLAQQCTMESAHHNGLAIDWHQIVGWFNAVMANSSTWGKFQRHFNNALGNAVQKNQPFIQTSVDQMNTSCHQ